MKYIRQRRNRIACLMRSVEKRAGIITHSGPASRHERRKMPHAVSTAARRREIPELHGARPGTASVVLGAQQAVLRDPFDVVLEVLGAFRGDRQRRIVALLKEPLLREEPDRELE